MKKIGILAVAGVLATSGLALAQPADPSAYQLNLQLVPRSGTYDTELTDIVGPVVLNAPGQSVRFTVRYFITDSNGTADNFTSFGLSSTSLVISSNIPSSRGSFSAALLTDNEAAGTNNNPNGFLNPDASGDPFTGDAGLHQPFRTGVFPASNGDFTPVGGNLNIFNALPIATNSPNHQSATQSGRRWGVYSFEFLLTDNTAGTYTINVDGNGFLFFPRQVSPAQTLNAINGNQEVNGASFTFTVVPAPGAAALLGLGGLVAARRRRA